MASRLPPLVGHRGAAALAPENTLPSFEAAARAGAGWVELDAKLTRDGVVIVMHDDWLDRTTDGRGPVALADWAAIRDLDAGGWFGPLWRGVRVPRLDETLHRLLELGLSPNIEIKPCPGRAAETARATLEVVRQLWPASRPLLLSSFEWDSMTEAARVAPELPRGWLVTDDAADWEARARTLGCVSVHCADEFMTPGWAAAIRRAGFALGIYTVNDPARARLLRGWGVDCIFTDRPDALGRAAC
ncbi:MAG: glycerophosphodiester phosphodiesterase [Dongiaceae bacterium]